MRGKGFRTQFNPSLAASNYEVMESSRVMGCPNTLYRTMWQHGKANTMLNDTRHGGRWGVVPASQHQEILVALASLIRAQRYNIALVVIAEELGH